MAKKQGTTGALPADVEPPPVDKQKRVTDREKELLALAAQPMTKGTVKSCDNGGMF